MTAGTMQMPPFSAACWVTPLELLSTMWELVSESVLNQESFFFFFFLGIDVSFLSWVGCWHPSVASDS